jgi:phosphatidylethanolamine-binding protein (PEBP) family uncharacterized protein
MKQAVGCLVAAVVVSSSLAAEAPGASAGTFALSSPAYQDNGPLPKKFAGNDESNPNCVGENISPPLSWSNPPKGTKSYALVLYDPEGRGGLGVVHWVAYGIPVADTGLPEGEVSHASPKFVLYSDRDRPRADGRAAGADARRALRGAQRPRPRCRRTGGSNPSE